MTIGARSERPVYFDASGEDVFAIVTRPDVTGNTGVMLLPGGAWVPATHRNSVWVRLARRLAEHGHSALRFDYQGVGESTGEIDDFELNKPHTPDAVAGAAFLRSTGVERLAMVGTCFGARTALSAAAAGEQVAGMVLIAVPVKDNVIPDGLRGKSPKWYLERVFSRKMLQVLRDRRRRGKYLAALKARAAGLVRRRRPAPGSGISPHFLRHLTAALESGSRLLFLYGDRDEAYHDFLAADAGPVGEVLRRHLDQVTVEVVPGFMHGFGTLRSQEDTVEISASWLDGLFRPN